MRRTPPLPELSEAMILLRRMNGLLPVAGDERLRPAFDQLVEQGLVERSSTGDGKTWYRLSTQA